MCVSVDSRDARLCVCARERERVCVSARREGACVAAALAQPHTAGSAHVKRVPHAGLRDHREAAIA